MKMSRQYYYYITLSVGGSPLDGSLCVIFVSDDTNDCLSNEKPVVVYGDFIEAYSCIAALLELGLSGDTIAFIEPFPPEDIKTMRVNCFNNETVKS